MRMNLRLICWVATSAGIIAFAGCGNGVPQAQLSSVSPRQAAQGKSWMLREAKSEDLLYVADWGCCLRVFSYPKGKPVGVVTDVPPRINGECSDTKGNVWVTSFGVSEIDEYAHGGAFPIARLVEDRNTDPWGCSVDPVTGNLAVKNNNDTIAIFPQAQGSPTIYSGDFNDCAYDNDGNLFADNNAPPGLFELPRGGNAFTQITLSKTIGGVSIQWDGANLAIVSSRLKGSKVPLVVYRVHISGTTGTVVGSAILRGPHDVGEIGHQFWVQGSAIVGPGPRLNDQTTLLNFWRYPSGKAKKSIEVTEFPSIPGAPGLFGVTVSVAPK